jgi:hypothetical protein
MHTATPPAATLADLAAAFPSWHIWRGRTIQDCVERRRQFEAEQTDVTIVTPGRPGDRWRAILPLGVLPDDGTTIGARSLCDLMDKLDAFYPNGG